MVLTAAMGALSAEMGALSAGTGILLILPYKWGHFPKKMWALSTLPFFERKTHNVRYLPFL